MSIVQSALLRNADHKRGLGHIFQLEVQNTLLLNFIAHTKKMVRLFCKFLSRVFSHLSLLTPSACFLCRLIDMRVLILITSEDIAKLFGGASFTPWGKPFLPPQNGFIEVSCAPHFET